MDIALVTGSAGLIGSETCATFYAQGFKIVGIDNDLRSYFFGSEATTKPNLERLQQACPGYLHRDLDIRDLDGLKTVFEDFSSDIRVIIHTAAQPSHDWAAREPLTDFGVNADATLNLLELTRQYCPQAVFIFTSTNKVYGDRPNRLPLIEQATRWELNQDHEFYDGIDESMSIDDSKHSLFGASKVAADILVQEYGRYFGLKTGCFRGGCLTGSRHAGAELHGFLAYLMKCCVIGKEYRIFGYKGKQVRDNIHSRDLVDAFYRFYREPRPAEVYNIGGGRENNCSILEAIDLCARIAGKKLQYVITDAARSGDHIWYISSLKKFREHYPEWKQTYNIRTMLEDIHAGLTA